VTDGSWMGYGKALAGETERRERRGFGRPPTWWVPFAPRFARTTLHATVPAEPTGENGELAARRGASHRVRLVVLVLLLLVGAMLLDPSVAAAQELSPDTDSEMVGRDLGLRDWLDHLPLALGATLLVVAVDAIAVVRIVRKQRRSQ
jgi:hypothetical protein